MGNPKTMRGTSIDAKKERVQQISDFFWDANFTLYSHWHPRQSTGNSLAGSTELPDFRVTGAPSIFHRARSLVKGLGAGFCSIPSNFPEQMARHMTNTSIVSVDVFGVSGELSAPVAPQACSN